MKYRQAYHNHPQGHLGLEMHNMQNRKRKSKATGHALYALGVSVVLVTIYFASR